MRNYIYLYITCLAITLLMMVSCTFNDVTEPSTPGSSASVSVAFRPYIVSADTRATYPEGTSGNGIVGIIDNERLKETGFGVFAQHTVDEAWSAYGKGVPFNFMWNQQVTWDADLSWTYSPVKYWPNDNQPADDKGAQGSLEHSYLNFFAYAPYQKEETPATGFDKKDTDSNGDGKPDNDGIVVVSPNTTHVDESYIYYRTSNEKPFDSEESVDLLWATQRDLWKMNGSGEGYVNGRVNLPFKHALSLFTVTVQGLFDHVNNEDASTEYPDDRDIYTKILIESVDFSGSPLFKEGTMFIAPRPYNADVPHWEVTSGKEYNIVIDGQNINPTFANRYLDGNWQKYWDETTPANRLLTDTDTDDDGDMDEKDALALYNKLPKGVSHDEVPLNYTDYDTENDKYKEYYYMVLPNDEYRAAHSDKKMKVRMVYYVITYDERLTLVKTDMPKYFSIVKNDITATFDNFSFAPNKKYKLRLQPGLTSAKFEVTMVDDWDTPLTLDPEVVDWYETPIEYDVK